LKIQVYWEPWGAFS